MHQRLIQRYESGCLMLMDQRPEGYFFLGTSFMVESRGYLLTAAHLLREAVHPVVVNTAPTGVFAPLALDSGAVHPVEIVAQTPERDLALLKMEVQAETPAAPDYLGNPETIQEGTFLAALGFSFGHFRIHNIMVMGGLLAAKVISPNGTNLLILDSASHPGDPGGPLINTEDGRIIGIIQGVFDPTELVPESPSEDYRIPSRFTYAVSIEYAQPLLENAGIEKNTVV